MTACVFPKECGQRGLLPSSAGSVASADEGGEFTDVSAKVADVGADFGTKLADLGVDFSTKLADLGKNLGTKLADVGTDLGTKLADLGVQLHAEASDLVVQIPDATIEGGHLVPYKRERAAEHCHGQGDRDSETPATERNPLLGGGTGCGCGTVRTRTGLGLGPGSSGGGGFRGVCC